MKRNWRLWCVGLTVLSMLSLAPSPRADAEPDKKASQTLQRDYSRQIRPLLKTYCFKCHSGDRTEAEIDLANFKSLVDVKNDLKVWQKVRGMIDSRQMPPKDAQQLKPAQYRTMRSWVRRFLTAEARAQAGDPGPVVLGRLSNAEYTHTIRDLTGVPTLKPAKEFPVDGAAGEGFTNTGSALVMSPSLIQKYLAAAKRVADHAVLLPDGMRFSTASTRRDETDKQIARIKKFYARFTTHSGASSVNLQGIKFATNSGGRLAVDRYLAATISDKRALREGRIAAVAARHGLRAKYLTRLWQVLQADGPRSLLLTELRRRWQSAKLRDVPQLAAFVRTWQKALWKFNTIGMIGHAKSAKSWQEPVTPIVNQRTFNLKLPVTQLGKNLRVQLTTTTAGDGPTGDFVVWKNPRLVASGKRPIHLRHVLDIQQRLQHMRDGMLKRSASYLAAAAEANPQADVKKLAARHQLEPALLDEWLDYLGINAGGFVPVPGDHYKKILPVKQHKFVEGWGTPQTPSIVASAEKKTVRIPGIAIPGSVMVHPSPTLYSAVGWTSPVTGAVRIKADITDVHPECGNGVTWVLQHRTLKRVGTIWRGEIPIRGTSKLPPKSVSVHKGELITFMIGPRHRDHTCDLTRINLEISETTGKRRVWNLAKDVHATLTSANPHPDRYGQRKTWHFFKGPLTSIQNKSQPLNPEVPPGSLLAKWLAEKDTQRKGALAATIQKLVTGKRPPEKDTPDALMYDQIRSLSLPVDHKDLLQKVKADSRFGKHPAGTKVAGTKVAATDLVVQAPATVVFEIPAAIANGRQLRVDAHLDPQHGREGTVQVQATVGAARADKGLSAGQPILVSTGSKGARRVVRALQQFRDIFPEALCYTRVVPVDEVVTLTLFYREDDQLKRLMLTDDESLELERLWDELIYISHEPLKRVVAFEQISEFATQDRPDLVIAFKVLKKPINERAAAFRKRLAATEPIHVNAVLQFANRAWRRALTKAESEKLRNFYARLRRHDIKHDGAIRLMLARVLTSPVFLYRLEKSAPGKKAEPVSSLELASRLSYFLWSSLPDSELRRVADSGKLVGDAALLAQTRRMLKDARVRRLAVQFACQWLHIRDFDQSAEKNEKLYPAFEKNRGDMYEESVRFFADMFRHDRSILSILNADHTFLNASLAKHYGIKGVTGKQWRKVNGVRSQGRGGILGMATVLSSQSGASRTSPILRGNWVYETLLGEKLPKPPAKVPQLPEIVPTGLTARQLIEKHSSVPACAKCHAKIDGYGFSLEQYDAVGRLRSRKVDTRTKLPDGKTIKGLDGLRSYLANDRRNDVVRQFCRKLLGYSLGREVQLSDEPLLDDMLTKLKRNEYRFSVALEMIVTSPQFRRIRGNVSK